MECPSPRCEVGWARQSLVWRVVTLSWSLSQLLLGVITRRLLAFLTLGKVLLVRMSVVDRNRSVFLLEEDGAEDLSGRVAALNLIAHESEMMYSKTWELQDLEEQILRVSEILNLLICRPENQNAGVPTRLATPSLPGVGTIAITGDSTLVPAPSPGADKNPTPKARIDCINGYRLRLAEALGRRFLHTGRAEDLENQIQLSKAVLALSTRQSHLTAAMHTLGMSLRARFERSGDVNDINASVEYLRKAFHSTGSDSAQLPWYETELGRSLTRRFERLGSRSDFTEALTLQRHASQGVPNKDSRRDQILYNLGTVLWVAYSGSGQLSTLYEAITYHNQCLLLRVPGHRDRHASLNGLAIAFRLLFERTNQPDQLDATIRLHGEALALRLEGHPDRDKSLNNISMALVARYILSGSLVDLDNAIRFGQQALALRPRGHMFRHSSLANLSLALSHRVDRNGDLRDLEDAIKLRRECLDLCPPGHISRGESLDNLGESLRTRFLILGNDNDLEDALKLVRESLSLCPQVKPSYGITLCILILILEIRFEVSGSVQDLLEAISLHQSWSEQSDNDTNSIQSYLCSAAASTYRRYFHYSGDIQSLEKAMDLYAMAIRLREDGHPGLHLSLHELASTLRIRWGLSKDREDSIQVGQLQYKALDLLPPIHPDRAQILCGAAHLHLMDGTSYFDPYRAADLLSEALLDIRRSARLRLSDTIEVLETFERLAPDIKAMPNLRSRMLQVYRLSVSLLPRVAYFGLDMRSRLRVLEKGDGLATTAAHHALIQTQTDQAVEILEEGRTVFWTQYLRLRTSFDALPANLREELTMASRQLELGPFYGIATKESDHNKARMEEEATRQRQLCERIEALVDDVRALPGFERFMLHDTFVALAKAAEKGPLVVLLASSVDSYAIIIRSPMSSAEQVLLPNLGSERLAVLNKRLRDANKSCRGPSEGRGMKQILSCGRRARDILREIWMNAVRIIVIALDVQAASGRQRGRLWVCPTGPFVHLPIHASGIYAQDGMECLSDYFVTSYTPTIGALINARINLATPSRANIKVLLAAVSNPFKWNPLPHAVSEIASIRGAIPTSAIINAAQAGDGASVAFVLENVPKVAILHLACHGFQSSENPLDSGFVMQDERLTMSRLMALNLPNAFLAFLSACETAKGDDKQPDQAINLATTMLFAGFKSVVGTMWSMGDVDGPIVAKRVYEELFRGYSELLDPDAIPYALDEAMHDLRRQGLHGVLSGKSLYATRTCELEM